MYVNQAVLFHLPEERMRIYVINRVPTGFLITKRKCVNTHLKKPINHSFALSLECVISIYFIKQKKYLHTST